MTGRLLSSVLLAVVIGLTACGDSSSPQDSGAGDASRSDGAAGRDVIPVDCSSLGQGACEAAVEQGCHPLICFRCGVGNVFQQCLAEGDTTGCASRGCRR